MFIKSYSLSLSLSPPPPPHSYPQRSHPDTVNLTQHPHFSTPTHSTPTCRTPTPAFQLAAPPRAHTLPPAIPLSALPPSASHPHQSNTPVLPRPSTLTPLAPTFSITISNNHQKGENLLNSYYVRKPR